MKKPIFASFVFGACLSLSAAQPTVDPSWTLETPSAFPGRYSAATVVFKNKLWVIGGSPYSGPQMREIWSSADGKTWEKATDAAACLPRQGHTALVFNDKLWVIAGGAPKGSPVFYSRSDVWNSEDGVTWTKVTDSAAFTPRTWHASAVFNGKMWILGGEDTRKLSVKLGDAWSSTDGATWTQENARAFAPRSFLKALAFQNKLWVLGGYGSALLTDVLSSTDGATWAAAAGVTGFNLTDHFFTISAYKSGQAYVSDYQNLLTSSDMIHWSRVLTQGPPARLGLLEMGPKLWAIGTHQQGATTTSPVYSSAPTPVALPKSASK